MAKLQRDRGELVLDQIVKPSQPSDHDDAYNSTAWPPAEHATNV